GGCAGRRRVPHVPRRSSPSALPHRDLRTPRDALLFGSRDDVTAPTVTGRDKRGKVYRYRMIKERTHPRRGLHGELVHALGMQIVRGELKPGDALPTEVESTSGPGVSRTVVREAIKVLAAKGLVVSRPKTGTQVRDRSFWNLMDPDVLAWRL